LNRLAEQVSLEQHFRSSGIRAKLQDPPDRQVRAGFECVASEQSWLPTAPAAAAATAAATVIVLGDFFAEGLDFADSLLGDGVHGSFSFHFRGD